MLVCSFASSTHSPPSCVSAIAEQLDAQVVGPLLLFQVLDFITNSVGGGSSVCVCVCGGVGGGVLLTSVGLFERVDETRVPAAFLHGAGGFAKRPSGRRLAV